jgi:hypothetical protein
VPLKALERANFESYKDAAFMDRAREEEKREECGTTTHHKSNVKGLIQQPRSANKKTRSFRIITVMITHQDAFDEVTKVDEVKNCVTSCKKGVAKAHDIVEQENSPRRLRALLRMIFRIDGKKRLRGCGSHGLGVPLHVGNYVVIE